MSDIQSKGLLIQLSCTIYSIYQELRWLFELCFVLVSGVSLFTHTMQSRLYYWRKDDHTV